MNNAAEMGEKILRTFLVDNTSGELEMLKVWMNFFEEQLCIGWASD